MGLKKPSISNTITNMGLNLSKFNIPSDVADIIATSAIRYLPTQSMLSKQSTCDNYLYNVSTNFLQAQLFKGTTLLETITITNTTGFNMVVSQFTNFDGFVVIKYKYDSSSYKYTLYVHTYKDGLLVSMKTVDFTSMPSQVSTIFFATDKYLFSYYSNYLYIFDYNGNQIFKIAPGVGEFKYGIPVSKNMYLLSVGGNSSIPYFLKIENDVFSIFKGSNYSAYYYNVIANLYTKLLTGRV